MEARSSPRHGMRCRSSAPAEESPSWLGPPRSDSSLSQLTRAFVRLVRLSPGSRVTLKESALELGIAKRRIYDITNVLEGIGVIFKDGMNAVRWNDARERVAHDANHDIVSMQMEEPDTPERLQVLRNEVNGLREEESELNVYLDYFSRHALQRSGESASSARAGTNNANSSMPEEVSCLLYLSSSDLCELKDIKKDTLVGVQYPLRTSMEVSIPTRWNSQHSTLPYRLSLCSKVEPSNYIEAKPIQVYFIRPQAFQNQQVPSSGSPEVTTRIINACADVANDRISSNVDMVQRRSPKRPRVETTKPVARSPLTPASEYSSFEGSASPSFPIDVEHRCLLDPPRDAADPSSATHLNFGTVSNENLCLRARFDCCRDLFTNPEQYQMRKAAPQHEQNLQPSPVERPHFLMGEHVSPTGSESMLLDASPWLLSLAMDEEDDTDSGQSCCSNMWIEDLSLLPTSPVHTSYSEVPFLPTQIGQAVSPWDVPDLSLRRS